MLINELQPILDEPALLLKEKKLLVIADLHIGIEQELQQNGLHVPSQTNLMEQRILTILQTYDIHDIILLGDIKHNIPTSTIQERTDVQRFLEVIKPFSKLHITPGNHDGNIDRLLTADIIMHPSDGFIFEGIGFIHGNRWPNKDIMECEQLVIGHTHPTVMLTDRLGYRSFEQCWVRSSCKPQKLREKYPSSQNRQVLVVPAFNPLCGGVAVNKDPLLGPFSTLLDIENAEVYLLDGSALGKVKDIDSSS
jgi:putative SbcD/Mre11-related phosphoesterase